jgi:Uma2 family endonuclease
MRYSDPEHDLPRTLEEFRRWHERQEETYEFFAGAVVMMAPGSKAHTLIKSNLAIALGTALHGTGCRVLVDGASIETGESYLIPDLVVTCQPLDFTTPSVEQPLIVIEVLSRKNEPDTVGRKLALYLAVPSIRHVLMVSQDRHQITHHERRDDLGGAFLTTIAPADPIRLDPPGVDLAFADVYEGVELTDSGPPRRETP